MYQQSMFYAKLRKVHVSFLAKKQNFDSLQKSLHIASRHVCIMRAHFSHAESCGRQATCILMSFWRIIRLANKIRTLE